MSIVISIRISRKLKEEAEKLGLKISEFLKRALEEEVEKRKRELLRRKLEEISSSLDKISIEDFVKHVREDREAR